MVREIETEVAVRNLKLFDAAFHGFPESISAQ